MSAVDARWADDIIVVTMDDGSIRRYSDWNRYDTIRSHFTIALRYILKNVKFIGHFKR